MMWLEYGFQLCDKYSRARRTQVCLTPVFDFQGFHYSNANWTWYHLFKEVYQKSLVLYPGMLTSVLYVNPPMLLRIVHRVEEFEGGEDIPPFLGGSEPVRDPYLL